MYIKGIVYNIALVSEKKMKFAFSYDNLYNKFTLGNS